MRAALYAFLFHAADHAFWLLTNVVLVIPVMYAWLPEKRRAWLEDHPWIGRLFLPRWYLYPVAVSGIVITCFLAFRDEYKDADKFRAAISGDGGYAEKLTRSETSLRDDETSISGPGGYRDQIATLLSRLATPVVASSGAAASPVRSQAQISPFPSAPALVTRAPLDVTESFLRFFAEAATMGTSFKTTQDAAVLKAARLDWSGRVDQYLIRINPAYAVRFATAHAKEAVVAVPSGQSLEGANYYNDLIAKEDELREILKNIDNEH